MWIAIFPPSIWTKLILSALFQSLFLRTVEWGWKPVLGGVSSTAVPRLAGQGSHPFVFLHFSHQLFKWKLVCCRWPPLKIASNIVDGWMRTEPRFGWDMSPALPWSASHSSHRLVSLICPSNCSNVNLTFLVLSLVSSANCYCFSCQHH
jgi:hypothetical protein